MIVSKEEKRQPTATFGNIKIDINTTLLWVELYIFTYFRAKIIKIRKNKKNIK